MPSPADARRVWGERVARAVALGALVLAWWQTGRLVSPDAQADRAALADAVDAASPAALAALVADPARQRLTLTLNGVPTRASRALLEAAQQAGVSVSWQPSDGLDVLPPLAMSATALADPGGAVAVRVAADSRSAVYLRDSLGAIDSAPAAVGGVAWTLDGAPRPLTATQGETRAMAPAVIVPQLGKLRLYAAPGWESRFAVQALEEAGWSVDAEFTLAPRVQITAGRPQSLDTATYAAVIALDSTAWPAARAVERYVRTGGGLVLFADAARGAGYSALRVARVGPAQPGIPGGLRTADPFAGLPLQPLVSLRASASVLERSQREGAPVGVAAWRVGSGRVLQSGWSGTWEWRMLGGDDAPAAHRDWWRRLVQRVAYTPLESAADVAPVRAAHRRPGDAAPLADLVARVGPAGTLGDVGTAPATPSPAAPPPWLFAVAAVALLGEWWSRRLRGAR